MPFQLVEVSRFPQRCLFYFFSSVGSNFHPFITFWKGFMINILPVVLNHFKHSWHLDLYKTSWPEAFFWYLKSFSKRFRQLFIELDANTLLFNRTRRDSNNSKTFPSDLVYICWRIFGADVFRLTITRIPSTGLFRMFILHLPRQVKDSGLAMGCIQSRWGRLPFRRLLPQETSGAATAAESDVPPSSFIGPGYS